MKPFMHLHVLDPMPTQFRRADLPQDPLPKGDQLTEARREFERKSWDFLLGKPEPTPEPKPEPAESNGDKGPPVEPHRQVVTNPGGPNPWRMGNPPADARGVYSASRFRDHNMRRYWDGISWSKAWSERETQISILRKSLTVDLIKQALPIYWKYVYD